MPKPYITRLYSVIFIMVIISIFSFTAKAQTSASGCVSDDTGYLYTNNAYSYYYETTPVVTSFGTGLYCSPTVVGTCYIRSRSNCRDCTGPYNFGSNRNPDYWYLQSGKKTNYVACPIDDYVGVLIAIAGVGVVLLRRNLI